MEEAGRSGETADDTSSGLSISLLGGDGPETCQMTMCLVKSMYIATGCSTDNNARLSHLVGSNSPQELTGSEAR